MLDSSRDEIVRSGFFRCYLCRCLVSYCFIWAVFLLLLVYFGFHFYVFVYLFFQGGEKGWGGELYMGGDVGGSEKSWGVGNT